MRRAGLIGLLAASAAVVLMSSAVPPAAGQANGLPTEIRVIGALVELRSHRAGPGVPSSSSRCLGRGCRRVDTRRAMRLYRRMLPRPLKPAGHPRVGVWLTEPSVPLYAPGEPFTDQHWMEGALELRVRGPAAGRKGSQIGWFPIRYPVTSEFWFQAGRAVGLPKLHDAGTSEPRGRGWRMTATPPSRSRKSISLDFAPGGSHQSRHRLLLSQSTGLGPFFTLNPALEGPDMCRVRYVVSPPQPPYSGMPGAPPYTDRSLPVSGTVHVRVDPHIDAYREDLRDLLPEGRTLADVIDPHQTVPGTYRFNKVDLNSQTSPAGEGGYGSASGNDHKGCSGA